MECKSIKLFSEEAHLNLGLWRKDFFSIQQALKKLETAFSSFYWKTDFFEKNAFRLVATLKADDLDGSS